MDEINYYLHGTHVFPRLFLWVSYTQSLNVKLPSFELLPKVGRKNDCDIEFR